MKFRVRNLAGFKADVARRVDHLSSQAVLLYVGSRCRAIILDRTRRGRDVHGAAFRSYSTSPMYISLKDRPAPRGGIKTPQDNRRTAAYTRKTGVPAAQRRAGSRGGKSMFFPRGYSEYKSNLYGSIVNLTKTGLMLRAVRYRAKQKRILIGVYDWTVLDRAHATHEDRPWLGIGELAKERASIQRAWREAVEKHGQ